MIKIILDSKNDRAVALDEDKEIGECDFKIENDTLNIIHTGVSSMYQGQGIARKLVVAVIDYSKENNKKIIADCSYAKKVIEQSGK